MTLTEAWSGDTLLHRWLGITHLLRRQLGERYARAGLSESRVAVLRSLDQSPAPPSQTHVADELGLSQSSLCALIERMRAEGLLERDRSVLDRRLSVLTLTVRGKDACARVREIQQDFELEIRHRLSGEATAALPEVLNALQGLVQGQDEMAFVTGRAA